MSYSSFSSHGPLVIKPISLSPWTNFDRAWTALVGYPADKFRFVPGKTPMSTLTETVAMILIYLVVIFGGREFMRNRQPLKLNALFMAHNFVLTAISGCLLILFAEQLIPTLWKRGLYENICGGSGWTAPLVTLYYVRSAKCDLAVVC
jgi:fatty acid elongase 3